jgi:2-oxoglutarate ferredoxin oxidoreductase subunit alpha
MTDTVANPRAVRGVVLRFAGDSGDGMQLAGERFTSMSAAFGNDLATLPDFPAEIRAPAGTLAGVSSFQVQISDHTITTPGDTPNVLVAMNPAGLKANLDAIDAGATIIVNKDSFDERSLAKAGYDANPLEDDTLASFSVYEVPMTSITQEVCKEAGVKPRDAERSKNFFALGLVSWMYSRPVDRTVAWIESRFASNPQVKEANLRAFRAGIDFGETTEIFDARYEVHAAPFDAGEYANVTGNTALSWGLITAAQLASLPLFLGSYPITPASDILHELSKRKEFGVRTFQAEDEIAAVTAAIGASYGGSLGVTTTSGPGVDLKSEAIGLAASLELPLIIVDVQRGGPSTGLPTKVEQSDLLLAMYGRHGEPALPIVAASTPGNCFDAALEAVRIAVTYRTPVFLLSDAYLANGSAPWRIPDPAALPRLDPGFASAPNHVDADGTESFWPYVRDEVTLARPWAPPGLPGLEHRIGGLEKSDGAGTVSYDAHNHERMAKLRRDRIARIADSIPEIVVDDPSGAARVLVVGWGSTFGAITAAVAGLREDGVDVAQVHLVHLHPFPRNLGEVLARYERVVVPELNLGQLARLLRAEFLVDARSVSKVQGLPFRASELDRAIRAELEGLA